MNSTDRVRVSWPDDTMPSVGSRPLGSLGLCGEQNSHRLLDSLELQIPHLKTSVRWDSSSPDLTGEDAEGGRGGGNDDDDDDDNGSDDGDVAAAH